jgi:hypothetical protein
VDNQNLKMIKTFEDHVWTIGIWRSRRHETVDWAMSKKRCPPSRPRSFSIQGKPDMADDQGTQNTGELGETNGKTCRFVGWGLQLSTSARPRIRNAE